MPAQTLDLKQKKGGTRSGAGRPTGSKGPAAIKKQAIKTLQEIMQDETAPPEARVMSAIKLIDINEALA